MGKNRGKQRPATQPKQKSTRTADESASLSVSNLVPPQQSSVPLEAATPIDAIAQANLRLTRWLVIWTAVLAIVAVVTTGVGYVQWRALLKTDGTTREAFTAVQRPFIIATGLAASQDLPGYWSFQTILENTGGTPTKNMTVTTAVSFSVPVLPDSPDDPGELKKQSSEAYPTVTNHFIGPHGKVAVDAISLITKTLEEMADNRADFFVYGIARYNDQFAETTERLTKFCFVVRPYKEKSGLTLQNRGLCHHWNCGDEDCQRDKRGYQAELAEFLGKNPAAKGIVRDLPIAAIIPFYPVPLIKAQ
ncbi:hypothetical protein CWS35_28440 [Bradyrhizobium sp. SK17]|uniref:hypothetical protein n=1 Tax=Bradyrhizobium sp. SK17 TaxID=2057741 RepID=UPI000C305507|nr:hypothetical protein [Bradyrhizobium sp. SK17]AUC97738.1 hypothetical protein CWS35_28440 [Bradyrhizobium sp. SK17]